MKTMESELHRLDHELYEMYLRSLEIAELKWLPNIKPKDDSYSSYPHIKGVMRQVDRLLYDDEENHFCFNASELYVLLCAILMHDIGKGVQQESESSNANKMQIQNSEEIISTSWADLGLPTEKVALIVAGICRFQAYPDLTDMEELAAKYYIDQFKRAEPIRGKLLGALLLLGDSMDNTCARTVPHFFKGQWSMGITESFRSKIADVRFDRQHKMIKEILDKECFKKADIKGHDVLKGDLTTYLSKHVKDNGTMLSETTLYKIANDIIKTEEKIALIKDELNIMGIPVKKWLIECDEQLFRIYKGKDKEDHEVLCSVFALEPIINLDYCLEVLKGICTLSGGIFAQRFFQYSELVNFIREEEQKTYKVKCAVRRLSLLLKVENDSNYIIYYDENNWSFYCQADLKPTSGEDQKDSVYNETRKIIEKRLGKYYE